MQVYQIIKALRNPVIIGVVCRVDREEPISWIEPLWAAAMAHKSSWEELLHVQPRSGAAAWRSYPTPNKASGGDGIPVELFHILLDDAVKVLHSICQQIWKSQQWPQDW